MNDLKDEMISTLKEQIELMNNLIKGQEKEINLLRDSIVIQDRIITTQEKQIKLLREIQIDF